MNVNLVETFEEAGQFLTWLSERRPVLAIDTETGGLDWWRDPLRLVQFGDHDTAYAIPFHLWGGVAIEAISKYEDMITFHNAKFDVRFLEINGAKLNRQYLHDTRVMTHLLSPGDRSGLKPTATRILGNNSDEWEVALNVAKTKNRWTWATVPITLPEYWEYACVDTILTARLYEALKPQLVDKFNTIYELEMATQWIIDTMERKGVAIDVNYCREQRDTLLQWSNEAVDWCTHTYGFGPGQNAEVAAQLQREGIILTKRTASMNSWSVDESVLKNINHPLANVVLKVRKARKYANAYFDNYLEMNDNGRIHPDVNTLGARTGRMSVSRPALQQIPREKISRNAFVASEGNKLVSVDFDQVEMRLFTHYCQDSALIEAGKQEGDFFLNAASRIYNTPVTDKHDVRRQLTKNASYAIIYGAGAAKFAETAGIPESEGILFMKEYHAAFPGVKLFQQQIDRIARDRGATEGRLYVRTPLGRLETCDGDNDTYKLVNYLVQGAAADTFKQALIELDRYGLTEYMVLPIHDEVLFDVPKKDAEDIGRTAAQIMSRPDFVVPLTCAAEVLDRWGDKYD